jgi:hypothetical protein
MSKYQFIFNRSDPGTLRLVEYMCNNYRPRYPIQFIPTNIDTPILIVDGNVVSSGAYSIYEMLEDSRLDTTEQNKPLGERPTTTTQPKTNETFATMIARIQADEKPEENSASYADRVALEQHRRELSRKGGGQPVSFNACKLEQVFSGGRKCEEEVPTGRLSQLIKGGNPL